MYLSSALASELHLNHRQDELMSRHKNMNWPDIDRKRVMTVKGVYDKQLPALQARPRDVVC